MGSSIAFPLAREKGNPRCYRRRLLRWKWLELRQTKYTRAENSRSFVQHEAGTFLRAGKSGRRPDAPHSLAQGQALVFEHCPQTTASSRGSAHEFRASRCGFASLLRTWQRAARSRASAASVETWLIQPLLLQTFHADLAGDTKQLHPFRETSFFFILSPRAAPSCASQLRLLQSSGRLASRNLAVLCLNLDDPRDARTVRFLATKEGILCRFCWQTQGSGQRLQTQIYRYRVRPQERSRVSQLLACLTGTPMIVRSSGVR